MTGWRVAGAALGVVLAVLGWWRVGAATAEIEVVDTVIDGVPLTLLVPAAAADDAALAGAPGVVVAHGFAGSRALMRTTALALAGAGHVVVLPDLPGHGTNPAPLDRSDDGAGLAAAVETARQALAERAEVDGDRIVLLGHSMGSGAVMRAAIAAPDGAAGVVAVSPTDAEVTSALPPNLLLLAGALEPRFVANAEGLLARAGGPSAELDAAVTARTARQLEVVPGVEHVTIVFSPTMHAAAAGWIDRVTGHDGPGAAGVGVIGWWLLALVGVVLTWRSVVPVLAGAGGAADERRPGGAAGTARLAGGAWWGAALGAVGATLLLAVVGRLVPLEGVGGMLVAPVLAGWFAVAGVVWLAVGVRPGRPGPRELGWAAAVTGVLVLAVGAVAASVWLPWWPPAVRAAWIAPLALAVWPWTLALAAAGAGRRGPAAAGWTTAVVAVTVVGLGAAAALVPGLGFVLLLLPVIPLVFVLAVVVWLPVDRPWAGAVGTAVLVGWLTAVLFPLV